MAPIDEDGFSLTHLQKATSYIKGKIPSSPRILIICGSGLGILADSLQSPIVIPYGDIPNFPESTIKGHSGQLVFGTISGINVLCMKGRFHYYEGHSLKKITSPVRIAKLLGVELLIITNAAGGVNQKYKVGDIMLIKDHINFLGFAGTHPLRGLNDDDFGDRFFPVNRSYDKNIRKIAVEIGQSLGIGPNLHEGVYAMVGGPNYESPSEVRALRTLNVDAVGMSTIPEVLVAKHCGLKVFGFSLITNECVADYDSEKQPNHEEVLAAVNSRTQQLKDFVIKVIEKCNFNVSKNENISSDVKLSNKT
ncbi:uncharacterized protein LOC115890188 [Sitophilus oryzae]|uniref:Purine nucleoside phosphorylase n=1 Tax=Sitophilus oryzae TaxID=7048 RepID=A0A6J2YSC8_SITOR|nr:uncharacterized protein LOC115890188 [Sitophilus oryzae]